MNHILKKPTHSPLGLHTVSGNYIFYCLPCLFTFQHQQTLPTILAPPFIIPNQTSQATHHAPSLHHQPSCHLPRSPSTRNPGTGLSMYVTLLFHKYATSSITIPVSCKDLKFEHPFDPILSASCTRKDQSQHYTEINLNHV